MSCDNKINSAASSARSTSTASTSANSEDDEELNENRASFSVHSFSPSSMYYPGQGEILISGSNFTASATVTIGGNSCTNITLYSANTIGCTVPSGGQGTSSSITVTIGEESVTASELFLYKDFTAVKTVAGTGVAGSTDGTGDVAQFSDSVNGLYFSFSNNILYVADGTNRKIRALDFSNITDISTLSPSDVTVSTLAGDGTKARVDSADDTGATASFAQPEDLVMVGSTLYVTDTGWAGGGADLRKVDPLTGKTTTVSGLTGFINAQLVYDNNFIYLANDYQHVIHQLNPEDDSFIDFAGIRGSAGNIDSVGTSAKIKHPYGLALSSDGQYLYVGTEASDVKKINLSTKKVTTIFGTYSTGGYVDGFSTQTKFRSVSKISAPGNFLFVADHNNCVIREVNLTTNEVSTLVGDNSNCGNSDGSISAATLFRTNGISYHPTFGLFFSDSRWEVQGVSALQSYRIRVLY